jgi:hypothetical protein
MGKPRMRFWLLASLALSVCALYALIPAPSHAQVLVDDGGSIGDGGANQGDPDQPNLKAGLPGSLSSPIVVEPRNGRYVESQGASTEWSVDRSPRALVRRAFERMYWSLRARWGW